jgi:diguanylate cyclase (GGDEF)-like protein
MGVASYLAAVFRRSIRDESGMRRIMLVTFVTLASFTVALVGGFIHATNVADEVTRNDERSLIRNQFGVATREIIGAEKIQLTWDDAVHAIGGQGFALNLTWADAYIGAFLWSNLHSEYIFLVSPQGQLIRAWHNGKPDNAASFAPVAGGVRKALAVMQQNRRIYGTPAGYKRLEDTNWPVDDAGRPLTRWLGGLSSSRGKPALVTIASIVPDTNYSLLRRTPNHIVAVRYLDPELLGQFSDELLLKDMRFSPVFPRDTRRNALELTARDGGVLGWLSWRPNAVGSIVVRRTAPLLATYVAFYVLVLGGCAFIIRKSLRLASEFAAREAQAQHHALHDPMLGLPNRTNLMQRLSGMLKDLAEQREVAGQKSKEEVLLAYFDIDRFKAINDAVGHQAGDNLLLQAVDRIRARMLPTDVLSRLASDEFVLLRRDRGGREAADELGNEIMAAFAEPFMVFGHSLEVTVSCGISWAPEQTTDSHTLLRNADTALFRAKQRGRARYRYFTRDMDATIRWRQDMEVELRQAIMGNTLAMVYQPIVHVGDGRIVGFEALLRWHHRDRGDISPSIFVPVAEQCGLMPQLGDWVLQRVFTDSHDFDASEISVNLSPLQLMAKDFVPNLRALIAREQIQPDRFIFEITEGVLLDRSERVMGILSELQQIGFRIALDDFGTGYSSLGYLRAFQFDRIKIDGSFVQGIETDIDAQSILRAIVSLGRTLRMKVVAEGVETLLQQQLVHAAGCQLIQGHLYWRALTPEQVVALKGAPEGPRLRAVN